MIYIYIKKKALLHNDSPAYIVSETDFNRGMRD